MPSERETSRYRTLTRRSLILAGSQGVLFGALAARMYYLQVVAADRYKVMADENRINVRLVAPERGRILDRFGVTLAGNQRNFRLVITAEQAGDIPSTLDAIGVLLPLGPDQKARIMGDIAHRHAFVPVVVLENLTWEEVARIEVNMVDLRGVSVEEGSNRYYPYGTKISHAIGYVAPVSIDELNGDPLLELPDFRIGKSGVEKAQDLVLRGSAGTSEIEVNALGRVVREISSDAGEPGQEVVLSIDMALQDYTMRRIQDERAVALCLMDAQTGEVLAMASSPAYDDNAFTHGISNELWHQFGQDPLQPLDNRTIQGVYPPGSTFKPCTALGALEAGAITPDFKVVCTGKLELGDAVFHCWWKGGHGELDLHGGIKHSCDIYFYEVARRLGVDPLAAMAHRLGLGQTTGIDIPGERTGLIPTRAWKLATYGVPWQEGETLSIGIGQGYVSATPLQLCTMVSRLVTNKQVVPHLVRPAGVQTRPGAPASGDVADAAANDTGDDGSVLPVPGDFAPLGADPAHLAAVLGGMTAVVNEQGGTAYAARILDPLLAMGGKSGTAQTRHISLAERAAGVKKGEDLPWEQRDHALFVAFAPVSAPRYVCSIVVEHGIGGSKYAAPIARDLLTVCQQRNPAASVPANPAATIPYTPPPVVNPKGGPNSTGGPAIDAPPPVPDLAPGPEITD